MDTETHATTLSARSGPIMVPEVLRAILQQSGVAVEEFLAVVDASIGRTGSFDSRKNDAAVAALLPAMLVEPAPEQAGPGPHLLIEINLTDPPITISNIRGVDEIEISDQIIPQTAAVALGGKRLVALMDHALLSPIECSIISCTVADGHTMVEITMPLVPLVTPADR